MPKSIHFHHSIKLLPLRYLLFISLILILSFEAAAADEDWGLCRTPSFLLVEAPADDPLATEIQSQSMSRNSDNLIHFIGDVQLNRAGQKISADELIIDTRSEQLEANGEVIYQDINYRLKTETLTLNQRDGTARFGPTEFELHLSHARGTAEEIEKIDQYRSRYQRILYTTCDPEDKGWHLTASELTIDNESGRGVGKHAVINFQNVPFIYLPYFMFPVDDRRLSGVLAPMFSYSEFAGASFALPVYWNIAPNLDATITPAWYSKRGLQMIFEGRYLYQNHAGQLDLAYLDDDLVKSERWFRKWQHQASPGLDLQADLLLQEVSDDRYFNDFDFLTTENDNISYLERHVTFSHSSNSWQTSLQWQNYQTVDQTIALVDRPYDRLPRLRLNSQFNPLENGLHFDLPNELVAFDRDFSVTGTRLNVTPAVSWLQSNSWYFFEPRLQYSLTEYRLDNNNLGADSISRHLPTFSLDTGLTFERLANARHGWIQTLEPRLFYLQTPFEDQNGIPDFDTADLSNSLANFYQTNRFSGFDRIGDANQITLGLGSRIYREASGVELMNLELGQIYYFEDRRVSLDGSPDDKRSKSDLIAQLSLTPNTNWKLTSKLVQQPRPNTLSEKNLSIHYAKQGFAANIGYFFTEQELEQALISAAYPLNSRWALFAKVHRSLKFDKPVENLLGMAYESCCWGIKILASQTSDVSDVDFLVTENRLYFELTLKGLGSGGDDISTKLRNSIPGYQAGF